MNSNSNSPSPAAEPGRNITGRFVLFLGRRIRGVWRFVFSRRMVWTLAILTSLLVLLYQYENWNGARELAEARKKMIARIGTDNYLDLLPEEVREAENFYAIDEIKSWREPSPNAAGGFSYFFPAHRLFPQGFDPPALVEEAGTQHLDLAGWVEKCAASGKPVPAGESPAAFLFKELGDGDGILARLVEGLDRPKSQIIPCRRVLLAAADGMPFKAKYHAIMGTLGFQNDMAVHLLAAALLNDRQRTLDVAAIMLRLTEGLVADTTMVGCLSGSFQNSITLKALNPALQCSTLTDADYGEIHQWLGKTNDLESLERGFMAEAAANYQAYHYLKGQSMSKRGKDLGPALEASPGSLTALFNRIAPANLVDANFAYALESIMVLSGKGGEESWREAREAGRNVARQVEAACYLFSTRSIRIPNPRRWFGCIAVPATSDRIWEEAAENLFRRRCAILTCALHRHRLAHGGFPEEVTGLDAAFLPEPMKDPAKAGALLNYRKTERGFLLWSVGEDRSDDEGDAGKDWIWRHEKGI